ncbi:hypothetical protein PIROE2DRAFT_15981 [Piromyces sp. E2]|nr:hypothetical protein PIROE2DRAFT_15981 [Piromyces sp. E2]|eukprot:OUM58672.1 hypothetical protein PIROE2DRAFT_15981 [Piromyces sp. E2]
MHFTIKDILLFVLAFFISPLAVFLKRGLLRDFWINLILYLIGLVPDENYEAIKNDAQYHPINEE